MEQIEICHECGKEMEMVEHVPSSFWWRCPWCLHWGNNIIVPRYEDD